MTLFSCMVNFPLGKMLQMDYQYISAATHKRSVELFFVIPKPSRILCLVLSLFVSKAAICTYIIRNSEYFTISAAYITVRWPDSRGETNMARALTNTLYLNDRVTEYNLQKFSA